MSTEYLRKLLDAATQDGNEYAQEACEDFTLQYGKELLAVVEASRLIPEMPSAAHRLMTPNWEVLNEALSALEKKLQGILP